MTFLFLQLPYIGKNIWSRLTDVLCFLALLCQKTFISDAPIIYASAFSQEYHHYINYCNLKGWLSKFTIVVSNVAFLRKLGFKKIYNIL